MTTKRVASKTATARKAHRTSAAAPKPRPTSFTPELFAAICAGLAEGTSLVKVCQAEGMPSRETVHRWIKAEPTLEADYLAAREAQADYYAEQILDIADDLTATKRAPSKAKIAAARVQIDARKWYAGKLRPKKWGDKLDVNVEANVRPLESLSDDELDAEIAKANAALQGMGAGVALGTAAGVAIGQAQAAKAGDGNAAG